MEVRSIMLTPSKIALDVITTPRIRYPQSPHHLQKLLTAVTSLPVYLNLPVFIEDHNPVAIP